MKKLLKKKAKSIFGFLRLYVGDQGEEPLQMVLFEDADNQGCGVVSTNPPE